MKVLWKCILVASLSLLPFALAGCRQQEATAYEATQTPPPAAEVAVTSGPSVHYVPITVAPTFTPTPTPTASPEPTPTPTPTTVPMDRRDFEGEVQQSLFPLWMGEAEPTPTVAPLATPDPQAEAIGKLCAMVFANVAVYEKPSETADVLGRESYHLLYVHSIRKEFYYVTTQEGRTGYVKISQVTPLSMADLEAYLSAAMELRYTADHYSPDAFVAEVTALESRGSMEERIYQALCRLGLDFEPFYYRVFRKDLQDSKKYPQFYKDEIYNSLVFKLFNSTGALPTIMATGPNGSMCP